MLHYRAAYLLTILAFMCFTSPICRADITRVYHPYVDPLESEIEFRFTQSYDSLDNHNRLYTLGYGQAVTDKLFVEGYSNTSESNSNVAEVKAYELEAVYQLTEKGAYFFDYGVLFEAQREIKSNISDFGTTLLLEKELGPTSLAANIGLTYEYGGAGIEDSINPSTRIQWRYRYKPSFEPALEVQLDKYDKCAGPGIVGLLQTSRTHKLKWEASLLFALDAKTSDTTFRALLEYEF